MKKLGKAAAPPFLLLLAVALAAPAGAEFFIPLGGATNEESPDFKSHAYAISADGRVVAGSSGSGPFQWSEEEGTTLLGVEMKPTGVSAEGSVIIGNVNPSLSLYEQGAARWTSDAGLVLLQDASCTWDCDDNSAYDVSADGTVVAGERGVQMARWTDATGWVRLDPGGPWSNANAVSADGSVVAGRVELHFGSAAFRWTSASGWDFIYGDYGSSTHATATGISADGSVIVGMDERNTYTLPCSGDKAPIAWRWTEATGAVFLHDLSGNGVFCSTPADASGDGTAVVGTMETESGNAAFYWTQAGGVQTLTDLLVTNGAIGLDGWTLETATGISDDGKTIVGWGTNPDGKIEAWVARPFGRFDDVPPEHWAFSAVEKVAESCITKGCGNGNYCPDAVVTRDQMAVFIERAMRGGCGYTVPPPAGGIFADVPPDHWAANWIEQLSQDCITNGCDSGKFCPAAPVNRDQIAVFLERAIKGGCGYPLPLPATGIFADVPPDHWAADWIEQLAGDGITAGCGNGNFCPDHPVTRAQMAVFLVRAFGL